MGIEAKKLNADLIRAIKTNAVSLFEDVLNRGASVDARDQYDGTAPMLAVEHQQLPMVERLLALGANVNSSREKLPIRPWTALHAAAVNDSTEITETLLRRGANINLISWHQQTPLHVACVAGKLNQVKILLDHGAKAEGDKSSSNSALMTALLYEKLDVAAYLLSRNPNSINEYDGNGKTPLMFFAYWKDPAKVAWLLNQPMPDWIKDNKAYFRNAAAAAVAELDDFEQKDDYETARAATIELFRQRADL
jgi:ankyrin repeat protein